MAIAARVAQAAEDADFEQLPQYAPIRHGDHESGDFFFVPRSLPQASAAGTDRLAANRVGPRSW